mmetsp:Transcript_8790/g.29927  ORF Transcript_8790/g.29927 Transcript_8790/m.29927 type:complete len:135 (-) Transcript_8790:139-543(-)
MPPAPALVLALLAWKSRHGVKDPPEPFPLGSLNRSYPNYRPAEGCFPPGANLDQSTTALFFPDGALVACSAMHDCAGFQVYVRPNSTRYAYIEYKRACTVVPQALCAPPGGQPGGGRWYAMVHATHCRAQGRRR